MPNLITSPIDRRVPTTFQKAFAPLGALYCTTTVFNNIGTLSGAQTSGVPYTALSVSGSGVISFGAIVANDTTVQTFTVTLSVDGATPQSFSASVGTTPGKGVCIVGEDWSSGMAFDRLAFNTSVVVTVTPGVTGTDKLRHIFKYYTHQ